MGVKFECCIFIRARILVNVKLCLAPFELHLRQVTAAPYRARRSEAKLCHDLILFIDHFTQGHWVELFEAYFPLFFKGVGRRGYGTPRGAICAVYI